MYPYRGEVSASKDDRTHIVICADDFGQSDAIDGGIQRLAAMGRLSATSCLSLGPSFAANAAAVRDLPQLELGLHLNFTEALGAPGRYWPLPQLLLRSYARLLPAAQLVRQIQQQLDAFEQVVGRAPDYVDGHQHVHQLPQIRDALLPILRQRYGSQLPWLRNTLPRACPTLPGAMRRKAALIGWLGAATLAARAGRDGMRMNRRLLGVYNFGAEPTPYAALLPQWLHHARSGDLLMCHPAQAVTPGDVLAHKRVEEYTALAGDEFAALLAQYRLQAAPLG